MTPPATRSSARSPREWILSRGTPQREPLLRMPTRTPRRCSPSASSRCKSPRKRPHRDRADILEPRSNPPTTQPRLSGHARRGGDTGRPPTTPVAETTGDEPASCPTDVGRRRTEPDAKPRRSRLLPPQPDHAGHACSRSDRLRLRRRTATQAPSPAPPLGPTPAAKSIPAGRRWFWPGGRTSDRGVLKPQSMAGLTESGTVFVRTADGERRGRVPTPVPATPRHWATSPASTTSCWPPLICSCNG